MRPARHVALAYTVLSAVWVWMSDQFIPTSVHSIKGVLFVVFSGVLLYAIQVVLLQRLRASQQELQHFVQTIPLPVVRFDQEGRIAYWNPAATRLFGWKASEVVGGTGPLSADGERADFHRLVQSAQEGHQHEGVAMRCSRKDGSIVEISLYTTPVTGGGRDPSRFFAAMVDVTEERQSRAALEVKRLLMESDHGLLRGEPIESVLETLCGGLIDLYGLSLAWIGMKEPSGEIRPIAARGLATGLLTGRCMRWDQPYGRSGPSGRAIQTGQTQTGRLAEFALEEGWHRLAQSLGAETYLSVPLTVGGEVIGVLTMAAAQGEGFEPDRVAHVDLFAGQVALSILTADSQARVRLQTAALEATANAVVITDTAGSIRWANAAFLHMSGYTMRDLIGQSPRLFKSGLHSQSFYASLWETIRAGQVWRGELQNRRKDGTVYLEEMTITPVRDPDGAIGHFVAVKQDITDRRRQEEQLQQVAGRDGLTGLPNRQTFKECVESALAKVGPCQATTLLLVDIDHFRMVNDMYGPAVGDHLLMEVGHRLRSLLRPCDILARLGPDEFGILAGVTGETGGRDLAEQVQRVVAEQDLFSGGHLLEPTVSVGAVMIDGAPDLQSLLTMAGRALNVAREQGRNRVVIWSPRAEAGLETTESARMALYLKQCLREGRFVLYYQPVVRLATGQVEHYEALLRLTGPEGGLLTPGAFLSAAEQYRLMPDIDCWVVREVLGELVSRPALHCFVNISGQTLDDDATLLAIEAMVRAQGVAAARRLTIEVTESTAVRDLLRAGRWMNRLIDVGVQFALDDFGIGFSSFAYLRLLPARFVKIDGSFVRNLAEDSTNRALVRAISTVIHTLGKVAVAEWVEDETIGRILQECSVEYGQGFGLGRPSPTLPDLGSNPRR